MARWRHAVELALTDEEIKSLGAIARSRSDPARRVERARMLLVYRENFSFFAVGQRLGVHHQDPFICRPPGVHASFARDHEYKRHGTVSLLAGIDLLTGKVHGLVRDRHRSREFIEFLKLVDAAYPARTAIKLVLDNHSAHTSRETKACLATRPAGRFEFTFTPKHGSWLNLIEGFFSKFACSVLRHIRVGSKQELKERTMAGIDDINRYPVIHAWSYKLVEAA